MGCTSSVEWTTLRGVVLQDLTSLQMGQEVGPYKEPLLLIAGRGGPIVAMFHVSCKACVQGTRSLSNY